MAGETRKVTARRRRGTARTKKVVAPPEAATAPSPSELAPPAPAIDPEPVVAARPEPTATEWGPRDWVPIVYEGQGVFADGDAGVFVHGTRTRLRAKVAARLLRVEGFRLAG